MAFCSGGTPIYRSSHRPIYCCTVPAGSTRAEFYRLPKLYDILHAPGTARELDGVERVVARFARTRPASTREPIRLLEPACGTGRFLRLAASRGSRCLGFDASEPMVAYAQRSIASRGLGELAEARVADMTAFSRSLAGERFDAGFNLINTIRHLESDEAMATHFDEIRRALRPGGVYIVGISLSAYGIEPPVEDVWEAARGRCRVRQVINYVPPVTPAERRLRREHVFSHLIVERPTGTDHLDSTYWLRTYSLAQWSTLLDEVGFETEAVLDEAGDPIEPVEPGYALYVLRPR